MDTDEQNDPAVKEKEQVTVWLDADIVDIYKSSGADWQSAMNNALWQFFKDPPTPTVT
jgi:uncharacterized protein (DUF4415 family)